MASETPLQTRLEEQLKALRSDSELIEATDELITNMEAELTAENTEITALKTAVQQHTSSKYNTSDANTRFKQVKNAFARQEVTDIADALHVFLETPNELTRALLSSTLKQYSEKDTSRIKPLLERAQAVYGGIEGISEPTTLQTFKETVKQDREPGVDSTTGGYGDGIK